MPDSTDNSEKRRLDRKRKRQERRRGEIIEVASALVAEKLDDFSVQELADELGISQPSVFYYFPGGKDELLVEVMRSSFVDYMRETRDACARAEDGRGALETLIRHRFAQFDENPRRFGFVVETLFLRFPFVDTEREQEFYTELNAVFDVVSEKLDAQRDELRPGVDPRLRTHNVHRQVTGSLFTQWLQIRAGSSSVHSLQQFCDDFCELVLAGTFLDRSSD